MAALASAATLEKQSAAEFALANVLYEKRGATAYVTLNRPKVLNALNTPT
jgi:enoyl-CoA hydratase